jgi:5-methylcytosine-specific restriction enzyme B
MSLDALVEIVHSSELDGWTGRNEEAFEGLFGSPRGRYPAKAKESVALRAPGKGNEDNIPFSAYIHPTNPKSGGYSGMSFVIFPVDERPAVFGLVLGTLGLTPDQAILGRPGHARKMQAIGAWLNSQFGAGSRVAWAKQDPTRNDLPIPEDIVKEWPECSAVFQRYGRVIYALFRPTEDRAGTRDALCAYLDVLFEERGFAPMKAASAESDRVQRAWFSHLMPSSGEADVMKLLRERRYVILQGPPGTGKTRMALELLGNQYGGHGRSIQFHPNTTYESFIGGLAPVQSEGSLGLQFAPTPGFLMQAIAAADEAPDRPYLLHIDEVNRADLSKVLGEALFLFEPGEECPRSIHLPFDFGPPFGHTLKMPKNLHILGTMNSADRSIAMVDVAVRRRFAYVTLWPQHEVVEALGCSLMQEAYRKLLSHFVEHAPEDAFALVPGHSYFLEKNSDQARLRLKVHLAPLLEEYLAQGYVGAFAEPVRSYLQWLRAL